MSQTLPNQFDPTARENTPNLAAVPAIRFLTTADFPPFNYRDPNTGELLGYNIELARDICASLDVACTIQAWPWEQSANALADGQGDALIAGLAMTAENSEKFDFSSVYMGLPARFVTTTDNAAAFSAERLAGETVSVRRGSAHEKFLQRYLPEVKLLPLDSEIEALSAVQQGQANAYFGDGMRASFWLNQAGDCCAFAGETYFRPDLFGAGLSVAFSADRDDMRQAIDWALLRLKQDGKLDELYLRWFPVGFY
ncbi:MAG: Bacterial extracellular solute-binding protein family 3 [Devosia sp.]|nr:Bacterial extracellular solute-binding protein family 3 [Devosia sp.]